MTAPRTVHAAIYVRISQDRTGDRLGVDRQTEACVAIAAARGWSHVVYTDNDTSASTGKRRPAYEQMLEDIRSGLLQAVIVWDLDRLTRRPIEIEQFIQMADRHGVLLASASGDVDLATDNGRLFARIKGAVARAEVERKSARQKAAFEQTVQTGKPHGGPRPFGFEPGGIDHRPVEAELVRTVFERFLSGDSIAGLSRWLEAQGVPTTFGKRWSPATVRVMLRNPRYAGLRGVQRVTDGSGRRELRHDIVGRAMWEPVVSEAQWRSAVARLDDPSRRTTPGTARKHLLTGLALCHQCGRPVVARSRDRVVTLVCVDSHISRSMAPIDEMVAAWVVERLSRADVAGSVRPADPDVDVSAVVREAREARARLDSLAADYGTGLLSRAEYLAARGGALAAAEQAENTLSRVGRVDPVAQVLASRMDPAEAWESMLLGQRRALVKELCTVTLLRGQPGRRPFDPSTVRINWLR